jgi:hypothetical protein
MPVYPGALRDTDLWLVGVDRHPPRLVMPRFHIGYKYFQRWIDCRRLLV